MEFSGKITIATRKENAAEMSSLSLHCISFPLFWKSYTPGRHGAILSMLDEISRQNIDKTMECITGKLNLVSAKDNALKLTEKLNFNGPAFIRCMSARLVFHPSPEYLYIVADILFPTTIALISLGGLFTYLWR